MDQATTIQAPPLTIWRCQGCNRILAELALIRGSRVRIKCKCNTMNTLEAV